MSHKCSELDRQIPLLLGVPRPVLEHVVFCHQEDSSWPLQEGAVLKKRFDEIFDSTRYAKALDAVAKSKKETSLKVKDLTATLEGLKAHLHAAEGLKADLEDANSKLSAVQADMDKAEEEIQGLTDKQGEFEKVLREVADLNEELLEKRAELKR